MKAMTSVVVKILAVLAIASPAMANDFAVALGVRSNSATAVTSGDSVSSATSFGAGALGFFDFSDQFVGRIGFLYNQRNFKQKSGAVDVDVNLAYVDIPVTAMYKFTDYAGAFAGPVLSLLASKECKISGGSCTFAKDPDSTELGLQFGASFKFAPQLGGEIYYEMIPSTIWENGIKDVTTVGANFLITFE